VRPTDENQQASNRPNLMSSSRRGGSEENILAMLDRDANGRLSPAMRIIAYGGAGIMVVALVGALVWLARDNSAGRHVDTVLAATAKDLPPPSAPPAPLAGAATATPEVHAHAQGAAIIDNPEAAPAEVAAAPVPAPAAQPEPPPLVLLSPDEAAGARGTTVVKQAAPKETPRLREAPTVPDSQSARPAKAIAQRSDAAPVRAPAKPASQAAPSRTAAAPVRSSQRVAAAKAKKAPVAAPVEAPVDRDVALISAIIAHSSRHAAERDAACAGDAKCGKAATEP
jgi:hypothetical protein